MFPDEINWPEGEDAPPLDAQELITLLLRQNPLERMGAGTYEHKKKKREKGGETPHMAQPETQLELDRLSGQP